MTEPIENIPATVPAQPEATPPLNKKMPLILGLGGIVLLIGISNAASLFSGKKKDAPKSALAMRPTSTNPQQVASFQNLQTIEAAKDAEERIRLQQLALQEQALQAQQAVPGPEAESTAPMTAAQKAAIYGNSPNGPRRTSNVSQAQAEAKQRSLAREKLHQDALASDTVAIDFAHANDGVIPASAISKQESGRTTETRATVVGDGGTSAPSEVPERNEPAGHKHDSMAGYDFDQYQGRLYRVFEGTVLEGIVTNHIDGGFSGPILVMLTTDYYSHDHQQLLMPQGTRLIGSVQSVGNAGQHKLMVTFHRAVCPDGFSLDFDKFLGLDPVGTTGLATNVDHGYLMAFGAAAAIGGIGGLAQVGNSGGVFTPSTEIRNGISAQTSQESEQILNHFLNRLPTITLKEGSRARVYIGRDILIPSYAEHRVDPTL